jgi:hypothetical protein
VTGEEAGSDYDSPDSTDAAREATPSCTLGSNCIGGGTSGGCLASVIETCSGAKYYADCECDNGSVDAGYCNCTTFNADGGTVTNSVPNYDGCSSSCANGTDAWNACGFPIPSH